MDADCRPAHRTFTFHPRTPGEARQAIDDIAGELPQSVQQDLKLLVSELVTNSIRHGHSKAAQLRIRLDPSAVRVDVLDPGRGRSAPRRIPPSENGGWGLLIVDSVADRWGVETEPTNVWFELSLHPESQQAS